jgi:hypothetical protein
MRIFGKPNWKQSKLNGDSLFGHSNEMETCKCECSVKNCACCEHVTFSACTFWNFTVSPSEDNYFSFDEKRNIASHSASPLPAQTERNIIDLQVRTENSSVCKPAFSHFCPVLTLQHSTSSLMADVQTRDQLPILTKFPHTESSFTALKSRVKILMILQSHTLVLWPYDTA